MADRNRIDALPDVLQLLTEPVQVEAGPGFAALSPALLAALGELVPCDVVGYDDIAQRPAGVDAGSDPLGGDLQVEPEPDPVAPDHLSLLWWSPPGAHRDRSGDLVSVVARSDPLGVRRWTSRPPRGYLREDTGYLREGTDEERQLVLPLGGTHGRSRRVRFIRLRGRDFTDFTDTDRALVALLRPHLVAHLQSLELCLHGAQAPTARQRQVLELLAVGSSNTEIARRMNISPQTVRTHLQQVYARLGVRNRTEAVAAAGTLAATPPAGRARGTAGRARTAG